MGITRSSPPLTSCRGTPHSFASFTSCFLTGGGAAFWSAQCASLIAFYYFYQLARLSLSEQTTIVALILFAVFPGAYCLSIPYSEALFCGASFATAFYLQKNRPLPAAAAAFICSFTRIPGLLWVFPPMYWIFSKNKNRRGAWAVIAGAALGFLTYLAINKAAYSDFFYFLHIQREYFHVQLSWPFSGVLQIFSEWPKGAPDLLYMGIGLFSIFAVWRSKDQIQLIFLLVNMGMLLCLSPWLSRHRYLLPLYPIYFVGAQYLEKSLPALLMTTLASAGLFALYFAKYLVFYSD